MHRRTAVLATVLLALGAGTATPAVAAAETCDWHVAKVAAPAGYDERHTTVTGTDSHGNYSGWVLSNTSDSGVVVLWTNGQPRVVDEFADFTYPQVVDENSAGTVLVSGHQRSTDRTGAFLYAGGHTGHGTLSYLPSPAGYVTDYAVALNERGDVLARGHAVKDGHEVSLLWSTLAAGPTVIDTPYGSGKDLDDDGTVLLYDGASNPAHLWRNGRIIPLAAEYPTMVAAVRAGRVIGTKVESWPESQSLLWTDPAAARPIDNGGTAQAVNAHGLIAGDRGDLVGPPAVWSGTTFLADLPLPDGVTDDAGTYVVGDDDTVFGKAYQYGALKWTCTSTGD
ncbi:hypothetical protein [Kutzneria kofuensis]|uniref:HAF family extracellular repeat protein n=1 Tax=Kutzneria kofuensis TaxID=103725 RepID=A0A7W9NJW0_9PSEU|nr:hypothetical protein [Kutzneria kofuensis]MBB5896047.1 hypothetical protein [Kutzneria kofuensis]